MSSRQLRKIQQQRELEKQAKLQTEEEEESEDEPVITTKSGPSLFANLAALEDEVQDEDEDEEKIDEEPEIEAVSDHEVAPVSASKKPKRSKKKKKAKKGKEKPAEAELHGNGADDIDAALRELDIKQTSSGDAAVPVVPVDPEYQRVCALLSTSTQHLKVAHEMRNLFGKAAVETHEDPAERRARQRQNRQAREIDLETLLKGQHKPGKGLAELTLRRNPLIQGNDDWPKATTGGLTMEMVDDKASDGTIEFRFVHDKSYQAVQVTFHGLVEMGDPQNLIGLLTRNPYHISLLIQVSKIAKDQGDHALSADLLERALFSFGRAAITAFNNKIAQGKARLDFARPENREFWLAGYQYIKSLIMKGTFRTALEWAKLLFSLDPEGDPYSMPFLIHHLALQSHEHQWFLDICPALNTHILTADSGTILTIIPMIISQAYAAMSLRDGPGCRMFLTDTMRAYPWIFTRLFKELNLDAPKSIWGQQPRTDAESLITELYVLQTKDLWNTPEATSLLMEIAHTIPKVDAGNTSPKVTNAQMTLNVVRFIYLDNTPSLMSLLPSHLLHRPNNSDADPLPPDENIFSYPAQGNAIRGRDAPRGDLGGDFFDPLAALARLVPGFRNNQAGGREENDAEFNRVLEELEEIVSGEHDGFSEDETESEREGEQREDAPPGVITRLMNMLWRSGNMVQNDGESDEDGVHATDSSMPQLVDGDRGERSEETDDEMPELVDAEQTSP